MVTKFYLHNATTTDFGTLPAAGVSASTVSASAGTTISLVNKSMDATIGTAQASLAKTTLATTTAQKVPIGRWLSAPLAAQTIAAQLVNLGIAGSESSTNSAFGTKTEIVVWRPSTGARVGEVFLGGTFATGVFSATTEASTLTQSSGNSSSIVLQDDDILIVEVWRNLAVQTMATAYTNTIFFDGTTEGSATTNAAYVLFANDVALSAAAAAARKDPLYARRGAILRASTF